MQALFFVSFLGDKRKCHRRQHADECRNVIPADLLFKINHRKAAKYEQGDDFLDDFQLRRRINIAAPTIGRHLQDVFKKRNAPTREDDEQDGLFLIFQMTIPGERHENV